MSARRVLVAGCGFLGRSLARRLVAQGWEVTGCTQSAESAALLSTEPFSVVAGDFTDPAVVARWGRFDAVVHAASSGRGDAEAYRRIYFEGLRVLLETLAPTQALFVSSTSVYAQTDGEWVTEESPAEPIRATGVHLRAAEELALAHGGAAARLAGLYGPGRSVLLKKFLNGEARIEGTGERWINQIHRDDAAEALTLLLTTRFAGLCNVADGSPLSQLELYRGLADRLRRPLPEGGPIDLQRKRGWTHKRVANARMLSLGWVPRYPSFFDAVENDPELLPMAMA